MLTKTQTAVVSQVPEVETTIEEISVPSTKTVKDEFTLVKDEFADASFLDPNARLPKIQPLRGANAQTCGYFISVNEIAKAGWSNFDAIADQLIDYTYETSGKTETGLLIQNPKMLVCPRSGLLGYDRKATKENQQMVIMGPWVRDYKEEENIGNLQFYEIVLLSEDNQPLHTVPLSYVAKGANGATFSQHWQQLVTEVTTCHAIANAVPARPKDARFNALCVFSFQTGRELVGQKQKAFTCRVVGHDSPTAQNWKDYFVGYISEVKQLVWESLQPELPLITPPPTLALAAAENVDF